MTDNPSFRQTFRNTDWQARFSKNLKQIWKWKFGCPKAFPEMWSKAFQVFLLNIQTDLVLNKFPVPHKSSQPAAVLALAQPRKGAMSCWTSLAYEALFVKLFHTFSDFSEDKDSTRKKKRLWIFILRQPWTGKKCSFKCMEHVIKVIYENVFVNKVRYRFPTTSLLTNAIISNSCGGPTPPLSSALPRTRNGFFMSHSAPGGFAKEKLVGCNESNDANKYFSFVIRENVWLPWLLLLKLLRAFNVIHGCSFMFVIKSTRVNILLLVC